MIVIFWQQAMREDTFETQTDIARKWHNNLGSPLALELYRTSLNPNSPTSYLVTLTEGFILLASFSSSANGHDNTYLT